MDEITNSVEKSRIRDDDDDEEDEEDDDDDDEARRALGFGAAADYEDSIASGDEGDPEPLAPPLNGEDGARFQCHSVRVIVIEDERHEFPCLTWNSVAEVLAAGFRAKCTGCGARISVPERFVEPPTGNLAWTNAPAMDE
jgi:hypothetical protein